MTKLYVNEFCIGLHNVCNWKCPYCIARDPNGAYNENEILNEIKKIKYKLKHVFLSGGEPGLLSDDFWYKLFHMTDYKLAICTNGTFIKKNFHVKYEKHIREIIIHCVSELDQEIDKKILHFIEDNHNYNVVTNIVLHNKNSHLLYNFLKKYPNINFSLFFTDSTFTPFHFEGKYDYPIQYKSCMEIFKALGKIGGYSNYTNRLIKCIINNNYTHLNSWSHMNRGL